MAKLKKFYAPVLLWIGLVLGIFTLANCANNTPEDPSFSERAGNVYCGDKLVGPRQTVRKLARIAGRRIENVCEVMQDDSI